MARVRSEASRASAHESSGSVEGGGEEIMGLRAESAASVPRTFGKEKGGNRETKRGEGGVTMGAF